MLRLMCISDIHGNADALQSAIRISNLLCADRLLCAGDLTGYGPHPNEVIRLIRYHNITCILGNYDIKVMLAADHPGMWQHKMKPGKWNILKWTLDNLSSDSMDFLSHLPEALDLDLPTGHRLMMVHGSPGDPEGTVYPSVTRESLKRIFAGGTQPDLLITGHTHIPFIKHFGRQIVVNCGSAGQPVDSDPRGAMALITIHDKDNTQGKILRFQYPVEETARSISNSGLPSELAGNLIEGRKNRETP